MLEAKEEAFKTRSEAERENRERRAELQRTERRLFQREESLDKKMEGLEQREKALARRESGVEHAEADAVRAQGEALTRGDYGQSRKAAAPLRLRVVRKAYGPVSHAQQPGAHGPGLARSEKYGIYHLGTPLTQPF